MLFRSERASEGFFKSSGEVDDNGDIACGGFAIFAGEQVAGNNFSIFSGRIFFEDIFQAVEIAGWADKKTQLAEAAGKEIFDDTPANESVGAGDQNAVGRRYDAVRDHCEMMKQ